MTVTDKQFERMQIFWGERCKQTESLPCQLELFRLCFSPKLLCCFTLGGR